MSTSAKPATVSEPTSDAADQKPELRHFDHVEGLLARYETEFRDLVKNPQAPADQVGELLTAIHALRIEKDHQRR